jgi:hypothetical protein
MQGLKPDPLFYSFCGPAKAVSYKTSLNRSFSAACEGPCSFLWSWEQYAMKSGNLLQAPAVRQAASRCSRRFVWQFVRPDGALRQGALRVFEMILRPVDNALGGMRGEFEEEGCAIRTVREA